MILYADTSALIKRYIIEAGSDEFRQWVAAAQIVGTSRIALAEANAALARAVRMGKVSSRTAESGARLLETDWASYARLPVVERTVKYAAELAWRYGLRGYDAVHLASADLWRATLSTPVTLVAYDRQLWSVARQVGLDVLPTSL